MYWLIEPHADDVFLSLHQHIVGPWLSCPKTIVTVFSTPKRTQEAATYAAAVGCRHCSLELAEGGGLSKGAGHVPPWNTWGLRVSPGDVVVFPVGLQHPDHLAVVAQCPTAGVVWRYLDTPYYTKQKLAEELRSKTAGMLVRSIVYASVRKWKHIDIFKSQAKFFHFNPPTSLPRLEIILRSPDA